jgi:hypothetical protein
LYSTLLGDATFHNLLLACDRDLANQVRRRRCLLCRSPLHSANYPRKPRGRLCRLPPEHDWRLSLCCARHGCRKRKTPPSLRFLGRKVYLAVTFIVIGILREGATQTRMRRRRPQCQPPYTFLDGATNLLSYARDHRIGRHRLSCPSRHTFEGAIASPLADRPARQPRSRTRPPRPLAQPGVPTLLLIPLLPTAADQGCSFCYS